MGLFLLRRMLGLFPILFFAAMITFLLVYLTPGDPAIAMAGEFATPQRIAEIRERMGFNDPFLVQFWSWASGVLTGDLGTSLFNTTPVWELVLNRMPVTLSLTLLAVLLSVVIGVPLGLIAGMRKNSLADRILTILASLGIATPHFWIGTMLVLFLALQLRLLPATGYVPLTENPWEWFLHMLLPAIALGAGTIAEIARQTRSGTIQVLERDHIRTARAMGLSTRSIVGKHVIKNAAIPVVTVLGVQVAHLLGGAVVVEQVFALPGLGQLLITSVLQRDIPVIQGVVLLTAVIVVLVSLLVDLSYSYLNPKVRQT
ncbi:ABC transporter permease [Blastococcus sp. SYSU DS0616]